MIVRVPQFHQRLARSYRYAYAGNDPINKADPNGHVPYNPGGTTSTGWTDNGDGTESYDSRTDRGSKDYLNQDGDNKHSIGYYESNIGTHIKSGENSALIKAIDSNQVSLV